MYGYVKTMRLCLLEYLIALVLHIFYGFLYCGIEKGRMTLLISIVMFALTLVVSLFVKNEGVVVILTFISVIASTTMIGYLLDTLAYSVLMYMVMSACITIFMEAKYILISAIISALAFACYTIFLPEALLRNISSLFIFAVYCICYYASILNLYVVVYHAKRYMKGMETKALEAEQANESKMLFLANMSHDIRTPMNAICGMAELTLRLDNLPKEAKDNTESIQTSSKVLISIINDILDYSKLESGKIEIIPVTYSFSNLINDVVNMVSVKLEDKEIEVRADLQDDLPDVYIGDEVRIRQILFNLLSNAVKFTDKGYVILDVKGHEEAGFVDLSISVTDSGIGIRREDLEKLFTSFQQVDSRKARNREGTGLGLAICKKLLNLMGGDITVESTYGVGTKFTVTLTQKVSTEVSISISDKKEKVLEDRVFAHDAKVLVVDDNAVNLKVAQGLIRTFGISVDTCSSGRECLDILRTTKDYNIIFIDHMMPELDGIDTMNLIRADSSEYMQKVPLVALTANVASGVREMFIQEGFDEYVPKPIDMVWLNAVLRKFLPKDKQQ